MDFTFDIKLKVKGDGVDPKTGKPLPAKKLPSLALTATGVPFTQNSPVQVASEFCFGNGNAIGFCVTPVNAVAAPATVTLLGIGTLGVATIGWRRSRKRSTSKPGKRELA